MTSAFHIVYTDENGRPYTAAHPFSTLAAAEATIKAAQDLQTEIFGSRTIQWPTFVAELPLDDNGLPTSVIDITEVPWS